jgi:hypothetical protein
MKYIFLAIGICIILPKSGISQDYQDDVETPKGGDIEAWVCEEESIANREYLDYLYSGYSATFYPTYGTPSSSDQFNCHGYAWYMMSTAGGNNIYDPRWIGYYNGDDEDLYMSDGSYVEVASEVYPGKVSWTSHDHSAITTPTSGVYKSKWCNGPLATHTIENCPYRINATVKYYKLCYQEEKNEDYYTNQLIDGCGIHLENVTLYYTVDVEVEFEEWARIHGTFYAPSGTTFEMHPE